ncbi:MAG TPA: DUF5698 domain-containing protein [Gemmataceae bacterium]|nr:DUF5698 domain-containing protein [Gemmataceae bacterium]
MNWMLLFTCLLIAFARVTDITLDTIRTVAIVQGRRGFAALLGFFEAMVYILAVAKVLQNIGHPAYVVAYAAGFAAGTYLGITIEQRLALGEQLVSVFTRKGQQVAPALRSLGYRLTEFEGRGRDGDVAALYIEVPRRKAMKLVADARELDADCFYLVHDVRFARRSARPGSPTTVTSATATASTTTRGIAA